MYDNKRQATRYPVDIIVELTIGEETAAVRFANLSLGGGLMTGVDKLPMDTKVQVSFSIPTHDDPIAVDGIVRWATDTVVGIQFSNLRAREVWSLNKFFEQLGDDDEAMSPDVVEEIDI